VAGYLPRSENDLFLARPGSNREGAFPRAALLGEEKVVFEARPGLIAFHPALFWFAVVWAVFFALVAAVGAAQISGAAGYGAFGLILLILAAPFLVAVGLWSRTSYALTDQRIVARSGDTFDSAPLERVGNLRLGRKSSTIVFELVPDPAGADRGLLGAHRPSLEWDGVPGAPGVASYATSAIRFFQLRQNQKRLRESFVTASMEDRISCEYCGALIPVASLDQGDPKCPRCTAPIRVAPLGV
jgi:hypothetical protein